MNDIFFIIYIVRHPTLLAWIVTSVKRLRDFSAEVDPMS
jgi:hypothetical protein